MLFDSKGKKVVMSDKLNSKSHPTVFARLREQLIPESKSCGNMFHMEERARVVDKR